MVVSLSPWTPIRRFGLGVDGIHGDRLTLASSLLGLYTIHGAFREAVQVRLYDGSHPEGELAQILVRSFDGNDEGIIKGYTFEGTGDRHILEAPESIVRGRYNGYTGWTVNDAGVHIHGSLEVLVLLDTGGKVICPHCMGGGTVHRHVVGGPTNQPCPTCNGDKRIPIEVALAVSGYSNLASASNVDT